jgi:hypothetical protein
MKSGNLNFLVACNGTALPFLVIQFGSLFVFYQYYFDSTMMMVAKATEIYR